MNPITEHLPGQRVLVSAYLPVPMLTCQVHAGFPSPAEDYADRPLDLSRRFVTRPTSSFVVQVAGDSMTGEGIRTGDYLLVDRSRDPRNGDVTLVIIDGAFAVRLYRHDRKSIRLESAHPGYPPVEWSEGCEVWGVVTSIHRDLLAKK